METSVINVLESEETYGAKSLRAETCVIVRIRTGTLLRVKGSPEPSYPRPVWAPVVSFVAFLSSIMLFFAGSVRCRGQVKSECGLRWSVHGHTRRRCGRACARVRKSLFWLSE